MDFIKNIFLFHKSKIFLFFGLVIVFVIVFFPYDDLSDRITQEIAVNSGNTLYVQFEDLSIGFLPQPGIKMSNVKIESPMVGEIHADVVRAAPSILAPIKQLPLGRVQVDNIFSGMLDVSTSPSNKINVPTAISADIEFMNFDLGALLKAVVPFPMKAIGKMSLTGLIDIDTEMKSQPEGDIQLVSPQVNIPSFAIETSTPSANGMPIKQSISIPTLNLGRVQLKGKMKNGKVFFSDTVIGSDRDDVFAKVGGDIDIRVTPATVMATYYNLQFDLTLKDAFLASLGSYATMVDLAIGKYAQKSSGGKRYLFRMQFNPNVDAMPIFAPY